MPFARTVSLLAAVLLAGPALAPAPAAAAPERPERPWAGAVAGAVPWTASDRLRPAALPAEPPSPPALTATPALRAVELRWPAVTGEPASPSGTGEPASPSGTGEPASPSDTGEPASPSDTGEPASPSGTGEPASPASTAGPAATGYTVLRGPSPDALVPYAEVAASAAPAFSDLAVTPGTTYHYAVAAANADGTGERSPVVSAVPSATGTLVVGAGWQADGSTDIAALGPTGLLTRLTTSPGRHDTPAVSPDGSLLAYTSDHGLGDGDFDLYVQPIGGEPRKVTADPAYADGEPAFSPDGKTLAFTRVRNGGRSEADLSVWTVPVAGGAPVQVPRSSGDTTPVWAPGGRGLAVGHLSPTTSIDVLSVDGAVRRSLVSSQSALLTDPAFAPDGRQLSYVSVGETGDSLWVYAENGAGAAGVVANFAVLGSQQWAPGGDRILADGLRTGQTATLWSVAPAPGAAPAPMTSPDADILVTPLAVEPAPPYAAPSLPSPTGASAVLTADAANLTWTNPEFGTCQACVAGVVVRRSAAGGPAPATPADGVRVNDGVLRDARVYGLTRGQVYRVSIFAIGGQGDFSPPLVHVVQPAEPPAVTPDGSSLKALSGAGPAFVASWGKALPAGQSIEVQLGTRALTDGIYAVPAYKPFYAGTATSKVVPARGGETYYFITRVRDAAGNLTAWSPPSRVVVPYDDRAFTASPSWTKQTGQKGRYAGTILLGNKAGATLTMSVTGGPLALIADRCALCGKVKVYVDGFLVSTVDTYARTTQTRQEVWAGYTSASPHRVKLVVVGTAKRPNVRVDGFVAER